MQTVIPEPVLPAGQLELFTGAVVITGGAGRVEGGTGVGLVTDVVGRGRREREFDGLCGRVVGFVAAVAVATTEERVLGVEVVLMHSGATGRS